jgi:hypothetical protein
MRDINRESFFEKVYLLEMKNGTEGILSNYKSIFLNII